VEIKSSLLNIIHELEENEDVNSSLVAALEDLKKKIKVRRIGEPLLCGLELEFIKCYRIREKKGIQDQV